MKKLLALVLALLMVLGCMSLTVFADEPNNVTPITATKPAVENPEPEVVPVSYEIVIPSEVKITKAGVKEIGKPSVTNVQNAEANTVISYKAVGTQLELESGEAMETTYYKAYTSRANYSLLDDNDSIVVYQNKAVVDPLTTLSVGVSKSAWDAAEAGTYSATITFNFTSGGAQCPVSLEREDAVLWRVIRKDADKIVYAEYYKTIPFGWEYTITDYDDSAKLYVRYRSTTYVQQFGEDCQVGDYYHHAGGGNYVKCINPSTHNIDTEIGKGVLFSITSSDFTYCRPSGSKCVVTEDGKLQVIIPGVDEPETLAGGTSTYDGETTKTIWYFNGTEPEDEIASGVLIDIEEYDVFYVDYEEIYN